MKNHKSCSGSSDHSDSSHRRRSSRHRARKERVLHTRVSEQLSDDIRRFAEDLRVPASNLVRNVLEEVFTVVDNVTDDVGDLFDDLIDEAEGVRERVRKQADSHQRRSRSRGRSRRGSWRSAFDGADEADVEAEFRRDETSEAGGKPSAGRDSDSANDQTAGEQSEAVDSKPRAAELFPDILGWQPLVLNRDFACGRCERNLSAGESAFLGLGEQGLTQTALCGRCAGSR